MKRILFYLFVPCLLLTACSHWLDIVPKDDMQTIDTDFETRDEAYNWLESCYTFLMGPLGEPCNNEAITGADELVYSQYLKNRYPSIFPGAYIATGMQNSLNPYANYWQNTERTSSGNVYGRDDFYTAINLCNIFISKIDKVYNMEAREKAIWKSEAIAVKAYYYFELVRHYGPIILVPENLDPNLPVEEMKMARSHVDTCFQAIVDLCDLAIASGLPSFNEQEANHKTYLNKEAVYALKARALLYQASDLFNGNPDYADFTNRNGEPLFNPVKDPEKWKRAAEAAEEAIEICEKGGKHLIDDRASSTTLQTHMANIEASIETYNYISDEVLWMVTNDRPQALDLWTYTLPNLNSDPIHALSGTILSPSLKMVRMFYTENGLPIEEDMGYGSGNVYGIVRETEPKYADVVALNEDILMLHTRREPRFYADIAADRCYWRLGRTVNNLYKVTAYQGEDFGLKARRLTSTTPENISGYWLKKWTNSKASLFSYSSNINAMGYSPFPAIRMAELYLAAAEAWNEYGNHQDKVYEHLNVVRKRAGIPDVEVSWTMARNKEKVKRQDGLREIIRQEWNIEYAFEGMRFWNLRRWKTAHLEMNDVLYGWNVTGSTAKAFYNNGVPVMVKNDNSFVAPRDYFWPILSEEILISGCVQNPGW